MTKFPQDFIEKSTLNGDDLVPLADSEDLFESIPRANKKFTLTGLVNFFKGRLSTTDVNEGTNLYFTDARVTNNSTVTGLVTNKADKTNVLEKNNTTAYTPTSNYHPATKKYVDDLGTNINGLAEESGITNGDELIYYNGVSNVKVDYTDLSTNIRNDIGTYIGITTRSAGTATGTQNITHGLGYTPSLVELFYCFSNSNATNNASFNGFSDGTNNYCIGIKSGGNTDMNATLALMIHIGTSGHTATVTVDATNITLSWTRVNSGVDVDVIIKAK